MTRYFKYIFISLIACIGLASCVEKLEMPKPVDDSQEVTLVPRVKGFTNQYITKGSYSDAEFKIKRLAVLIFNSEGNLAFSKEYNTSPVVLNKTMLNLSSATVVMFANVSLSDIKKQTIDAEGTSTWTDITTDTELTIEGLDDYSIDLGNNPVVLETELGGDAFNGFPMKGVASNVNLTPSASDAVEVNLQILYAKINVEIGVAAGTENQNYQGVTPSFTPSGYSVTNVPTSTPVKELNDDEANGVVESTPIGTAYKYTGTQSDQSKTVNTNTATFSFYMAESRYNHGGIEGVYPVNLPEENKQQYKPLLASNGTGSPATGQATYVTVNGTYIDYRGTNWNVSYDVYLGKNNYDNFHVDRNSEYTNILTIKGIRNNSGYGTDDVWIDHRVDVSTNDIAKHVTITRETLIDSHIEVRPLRVKWEGDAYAGVRVYLPTDSNGKLIDWIGIERFTGENCLDGSTYCYVNGQAIGKRRYFTTSLISDLQSKKGELGVQTDKGKEFIYLLNGDCAWIYFDENTTPSDRIADIKLQFFDDEGNSKGEEVYQVKQCGLQPVDGYVFESYEEYLHTYDSADKYNLSTSPIDYTQQGLVWGLSNSSVSNSHIASLTAMPVINLYANTTLVKDVRYDFLHASDGQFYVYSGQNGWNALGDEDKIKETGLYFTNRATESIDGVREGITIQDMGTLPTNAYQYCLSKNKFTEDLNGEHKMDIHWYLPDVFELETILKANSSSADLKKDAYYWSSQPAYSDRLNSAVLDYLAGVFGGEVAIVDENVEQARAASSSTTKGINSNRTNKYRIRCFYSEQGIKNVDMSDRAPDGMGGNFTFWMKGWTDGSKGTAGFFNYLLPSPPTPTGGEPETSDIPDVTFPTKNNSQGANVEFPYIVMQGKNGQIEGFEKDPGAVANWREYSTVRGYYYVLTTYPGLTEFTLTELPDWLGVRVSKPTETRKAITQTSTKTSKVEKTQSLPSTLVLNPLDTKLKISFSQANGNTAPLFTYDELYSRKKTTSTQYWNKPIYASTTHELNPESQTPSSQGSGSETGISTGTSRVQEASVESAKKVAFDGTRDESTLTYIVDGAYPKAKSDAKGKLDELLKAYPTSDGWVHGSYNYTSLSWNQEVPNIQWSKPDVETGSYWTLWDGTVTYTKKVTITCTVTLTGSITVTKPGSKTLFLQTEGTGIWTTAGSTTENSGPTVNTDELRMYCGNSFTISLNDAYKNDYEITKVKVHFSGSDLIEKTGGIFGAGEDEYYARFVDSTIDLTDKSEEISRYGGGTATLQMPGMEYSEVSGKSVHQWTGEGRTSVTLVLSDYMILDNLRQGTYVYKYQNASRKLSQYFIIDKIEVKCTKKATAATEQ